MKHQHKAGFRQVVEAVREQNLERTFRRAQLASRCAKVTRTRRSSGVAYEVKSLAISRAIELAPERVEIGDRSLLAAGLIGLFVQDLGGLHVPLDDLTPAAVMIVRGKLGEAVAECA